MGRKCQGNYSPQACSKSKKTKKEEKDEHVIFQALC